MNIFYHVLERMKLRGDIPKTFIDAGAHFGETNDVIRAVYPNSRIISFEANPNCEKILKQKGIEYVICLLGNETVESVPFYVNKNDASSTGCSIYKENTHHFDNCEVVNLPMYALDDIVPEEIVPDFLKMDVQGAEIKILEGSNRILKDIKWIFLEVSFVEYNLGAPLFKEVCDYLYSKGYKIIDICEPTWLDNNLIQCNFLFGKI